MAINFPNSPSAGDPHSEAGINWIYDGEKWVAQSETTFWARTGSTLSPSTAGDNISTTGDLTAGCTTTGTSGSSGEAQVVGYQQGTWTPTVSEGTVAAAQATWFRIGNAVTVYARVTDFSNTVSSQSVEIRGLPYSHISGAEQAAGSIFYRYVNKEHHLTSYVTGNGGTDAIYAYGGSAGNFSTLSYNNLNHNGTTQIYLTATYTTDNTDWAPINGATIS